MGRFVVEMFKNQEFCTGEKVWYHNGLACAKIKRETLTGSMVGWSVTTSCDPAWMIVDERRAASGSDGRPLRLAIPANLC